MLWELELQSQAETGVCIGVDIVLLLKECLIVYYQINVYCSLFKTLTASPRLGSQATALKLLGWVSTGGNFSGISKIFSGPKSERKGFCHGDTARRSIVSARPRLRRVRA